MNLTEIRNHIRFVVPSDAFTQEDVGDLIVQESLTAISITNYSGKVLINSIVSPRHFIRHMGTNKHNLTKEDVRSQWDEHNCVNSLRWALDKKTYHWLQNRRIPQKYKIPDKSTSWNQRTKYSIMLRRTPPAKIPRIQTPISGKETKNRKKFTIGNRSTDGKKRPPYLQDIFTNWKNLERRPKTKIVSNKSNQAIIQNHPTPIPKVIEKEELEPEMSENDREILEVTYVPPEEAQVPNVTVTKISNNFIVISQSLNNTSNRLPVDIDEGEVSTTMQTNQNPKSKTQRNSTTTTAIMKYAPGVKLTLKRKHYEKPNRKCYFYCVFYCCIGGCWFPLSFGLSALWFNENQFRLLTIFVRPIGFELHLWWDYVRWSSYDEWSDGVTLQNLWELNRNK